ncbi:hypothetical protein EBI01_08580 [Marinomonas rhizomae]|nr:hypothetical protein EBI01_08580 [Marinomonas rhizomae]
MTSGIFLYRAKRNIPAFLIERKTKKRAKKCLKNRRFHIFKLVYFTKLLILIDLAEISLLNIRKAALFDADKEP